MWVALSEDYVFDMLTAPDVRGAVDKAIGALKKAGMTSESYVGVAHGSGGMHGIKLTRILYQNLYHMLLFLKTELIQMYESLIETHLRYF